MPTSAAAPLTGQNGQPRTVHVEHCMGTVFSIDIRDAGEWSAVIADVVTWLHHVDAVFSTYRPDSVISRLAAGEISRDEAEADGGPEVREVLDACDRLAATTRGAFTATPAGRLDPSGYVKGWAIDTAARMLAEAGVVNGAVNGGGDMQLLGGAAAGRPWRVGIADPTDAQRVLTVVEGRDLAVATSGTAERGGHITDPTTGAPAAALRSVTVTGPRLAEVDAYATAAFVLGAEALDWIATLDGYEAMTVATDGSTARTSGFPAVAAEAPAKRVTRSIRVTPGRR
jgi:thiamine biosynthesis lipoprotein